MAKKKPALTAPPVDQQQADEVPRTYWLMAENAAHAANSARDLGWEKTKTGWKSHEGFTVRFLGDETKLAGIENGFVAEGYRWYAAIRPDVFHAATRAGRAQMWIPSPKPEAK